MNKIFWGLIFLLFDFNIKEISILPAFVGYLLICFGMKEYNAQYEAVAAYTKARPWVIAAAVWSAIFWLPLLRPGYLSVIGTALLLAVTYFIVHGVEQMEPLHERDLGSARLRKAWYITLVCLVVSYLANILATTLAAGLAGIAMIVWLVAAIIYLVAFYRCKKALEDKNAQES
ncbi:MAG: hypothetical protein IKM11_07510 [Oscillospiraceae bacterium]|nr:hypothetical protein [Oscillospiraceae bacterium]